MCSSDLIGGHPIENAGYDMTFVQSLHKRNRIVFADPPKEEASWFYMWGGRGYHMSGQGYDKPGQMNVIERHSLHIEKLRVQGKIPTGRVELKPTWKYDYPKVLQSYLKAQK